ncbi:TPA: hypothetical protein ACGO1T_001076 [Streptococcus suis]
MKISVEALSKQVYNKPETRAFIMMRTGIEFGVHGLFILEEPLYLKEEGNDSRKFERQV